MAIRVLYLHGLGARPGGIKPQWLQLQGCEVRNPALPDDDFAASIRLAEAAYDASTTDVIVGSSRGGAVAMAMRAGRTPRVLICPAWRHWGAPAYVPGNTWVLHSAHDTLVPLEDSRQLVEQNGLSSDRLLVVGNDHAMNDPSAQQALIEVICQAVGAARADVPPKPSG